MILIIDLIRNETLLRDYPNHQFVAGGSTQNTMRAATVTFPLKLLFKYRNFFKWMLQQPGACVYIGCVGQDKYHQLLHDVATKAGLTLSYQVHVDPEGQVQTGTCAVLITGKNRYNTRREKKDCLLSICFFFFRIGP